MRRLPIIATIAITLVPSAFTALPVKAQSLFDSERGRYQIEPVNGGLARLDTNTGRIDFCRADAGAIRCEAPGAQPAAPTEAPSVPAEAGAEESTAPSDGERIDALEKRVAKLEAAIGRPLIDKKAADAALDHVQSMLQNFADMIGRLEERHRTTPSPDTDSGNDDDRATIVPDRT